MTDSAAQCDQVLTSPGEDLAGGPIRERTFTWSDPLAVAGISAELSGVELFKAMAEGRVPLPPIFGTLDFFGFSFEEGRVGFTFNPQEFHYNPLGSVQGGVYAALMDSACGFAVHTRLPAGVSYTSLDLSVKFLRPVTVDTGPVTAESTLVHLGRRTALAEARIRDVHGKIYATATSSCLIMNPEA